MHPVEASTSGTPTPAAPWTIALLGPGGIGGLLAALLTRAGHRVICLASDGTAATLRDRGLQVSSSQHGDFHVAVEADTNLAEHVDLCLIAVKYTALDAALDRVPADVLGACLMVPLLNGIEHVDALRSRYPSAQVVPAVIRAESTRTSPGVIEHGSPFTEIDLAGSPEQLSPLAAMLTHAGVETKVLPDEAAVMWAKLAFLAPFALLTTRYQVPIGTIRTERREELAALVAETTAVSAACGAPVDTAGVLARYDRFPHDSKSSMQRDSEAGRPLELDAIGGALLRAADRHDIDVPFATRLVSELTHA